MKIGYFDCFSGAAGDMIVAACLDAGADAAQLCAALKQLPLDHVEIAIEKIVKKGVAATQFKPIIQGLIETPGGQFISPHDHHHDHHSGHRDDNGHSAQPHSGHHHHPPSPDHHHDDAHQHAPHTHNDHHTHDHKHPDASAHTHAPHAPHRDLAAVCDIITQAHLSPRVTQQAIQIYQRLAQAEAAIHHTTVQAIHFHEVGSDDAIIDIVGSCVALELLNVDAVYASVLTTGQGTVRCAHGVMPVPAPATAELLKGVSVTSGNAQGELLTPTGAAILTTLCKQIGTMPPMQIETQGYGAGTRDLDDRANVLRLLIGQSTQTNAPQPDGDIIVLETTLDDCTGEIIGNTIGVLLECGALDAVCIPVTMKKSRPGIILQVLCDPALAAMLEEVIFKQTTTLGIRRYPCQRRVLDRHTVEVTTPWQPVKVKVATLAGKVMTVSPEYEDCWRIAQSAQVPLPQVYHAAQQAYWSREHD